MTTINIINRPAPVQLPQGFGKTAPTIASSAMLADVSISVWTGRKKDKRASEEVAAANRAKRGVARVTKDLLGDCEELSAVQKFAEQARSYHRFLTLPWSDIGPRLLPTAQFFGYQKHMTMLQDEFGRLVDKFLDAYSWEISNAQVQLGDLFNMDEYPSVDAIRDKFGFRMNFIPLPEAGDWRVDIEAETKAALVKEYKTYFDTQLSAAMGDLWGRLRDTLTMLTKQLEPVAEGEKARRIYDSVVDRAHELIAMMETCNVTNDPDMAAMQRRLKAVLDGASADAFRSDDIYKAETKRKLDEAIAALPGLGW